METLAAAVRSGNRMALSKALTIIESTKPEHQVYALELLHNLQSNLKAGIINATSSSTGPAAVEAPLQTPHPSTLPLIADDFRIGVSGPPGAGKSSLIEVLGCSLVDRGEKVAVLAVDPSSDTSGGAILGDKTRMPKLSTLDAAYVRPSPTRGTLGGVSRTTSEALVICAAAGYTRLLVETVGVGQSEIAVADLVDCMLLVLPPVGGDELQSIKRGITEVADIVVVNKADGPTRLAAARAAASFRGTMHLRPPRKRNWTPAVLSVSAHTGEGVEKLRETLEEYREIMTSTGELNEWRARHRNKVAWTATQEMLIGKLKTDPGVRELYHQLLPDIATGFLGPRSAATQLVGQFCNETNVGAAR